MSNSPPTCSHPVTQTSLDGRGERGPRATRRRHLYYRLYQEDGAIESRSPAYSNDHFVGRILSKNVTPPHTAASLTIHICKIEGFEGSENASCLYSSLQSQTVLEASARLALMSRTGPGSSKNEPMVLVIKNAGPRSSGGPQTPGNLSENPAKDIRYVHYRFYNKHGETASKASFDEVDPGLGRINALSVALPLNVASLKARLARAEGVGAENLKLLEDLNSDSPMSDSDNIALLTDKYPGSTANEPMAFICSDSASQPQLKFVPWLTIDDPHPGYLPIREGEILLSDGVIVRKRGLFPINYKGYIMRNSAGQQGFVWRHYVTKL